MIEVKRSNCDCHPETCCCSKWEAWKGKKFILGGNTEEEVKKKIRLIQEVLNEQT